MAWKCARPTASSPRSQFVNAYAGKTQARLRLLLSWDSKGTDLDLYIVTPNGGHAWYGNRVRKDGSAIDADVATSYGPRSFAARRR